MEIQVRKLSDDIDTNICLLPQNIFDNLNLSKEVQYNIHVGQLNQYVYIDAGRNQDNIMLIPNNIFNELLLFDDLTLNIRKENNDIYLGPVVAIFVNKYTFSYYEDGSAHKYHARAGISEHCFCYTFSIDNICWQEKKIKGYTLSPSSNQWVAGWFPMPDVIYDRGVGFDQEEKPLVKEIRNKFKNHNNMQVINRREYLGKLETYEQLSKYTEMCKYLPKTIRYTNFNDVLIMLKQYNFIFLKQFYGSGGKHVLSVEQQGDKYNVIFYSGELKKLVLNDIDELRKCVENYIQEEGKRFVIQKGIRLLKYKDQVFDMRVFITKDNKGKWRVIYNQARIAQKDFTITNYSAGGDLELYENIYSDLSSPLCKGKIPDYDEIGKATIEIAEYIEKAFDSFGELGMDIAIDMYGKIWFIEANTKPDKDLIPKFDDLEGIPLQNLAVFQYAKYLAHF